MDELTYIKEVSVMRKGLSVTIDKCLRELDNLFTSRDLGELSKELEKSNSDMMYHGNMHKSMCEYKVFTELASTYKKAAEKAKKSLDTNAAYLGCDVNTIPDQRNTVYEGEFVFVKRQNKDSTSTAVNDVVTELAKMGVDPFVVAKAVKAAAKVKRGATYYEVELSE